MNTIEAESEVQALAIRPEQAVAPVAPEAQAQITPAQAKVDAIASLTMSAYSRAGTLELTPEESAALAADFPDEAFKPGAGGKEMLLYIEHAFLRDRFAQVFGMGKWAIVPRNRWAESFKTKPSKDFPQGQDGERVYVEAMLIARGCFIGEAVGAMEYYPHNASQNYGDAVEGAKTAAFRRCAKEFGVGLQAWKKDWCDGWWQRKRAGFKTPRAPQPKPEPQKPEPAKAFVPKFPTAQTRQWALTELVKAINPDDPAAAECQIKSYLENAAIMMPNEQLGDLDLRWVPNSHGRVLQMAKAIEDFVGTGEAKQPYEPLVPPDAPKAKPAEKAASKPIEVPRDEKLDSAAEQEAWREFQMPFGKNAGVPLAELDKNYLFGLWANFEVETEYNGKPKKPETIAKDTEFRHMLDDAGEHYDFKKD